MADAIARVRAGLHERGERVRCAICEREDAKGNARGAWSQTSIGAVFHCDDCCNRETLD